METSVAIIVAFCVGGIFLFFDALCDLLGKQTGRKAPYVMRLGFGLLCVAAAFLNGYGIFEFLRLPM